MSDLMYSFTAMGIAILTASIAYFIMAILMKRWERLTVAGNITLKMSCLKRPLRLLIPSFLLSVSFSFSKLDKELLSYLNHAANILVIIAAGWLAMKIITMLKEGLLTKYDIEAADNLAARRVHTQLDIIEKVINAVVLGLTLACVLMTFPRIRQIGVSMLASAGVLGIVLGFATQKTLGNFIAGIQIAITQPIRIDDVVIVENEWGWIEEIALTYVVVRIWDLRRLVVPISYFNEKAFQNWTRISADLLGTVYLYADYTVPVRKIRDELTRLLNNSKHWDKKVNVLQVTNMTERAVELRALMSAKDSPTAWNLRCEIREKLLEYMQKNFPGALPKTRVELNRKEG